MKTVTPISDDGFISRNRLQNGLMVSILASASAMPWVAVAFGMPITMLMESLGGRAVVVGMIATIQQLSTMAQIPAALYGERLRYRKPLWFIATLIHRALWIMPVFLLMSSDPRVPWVRMSILLMIALSGLLGQIGVPLWFSWMGDLIPERLRSDFWGKRQTVVMFVHLLAVFVVGNILDMFPDPRDGAGSFAGFQIVFLIAAISGVVDIIIHAFVPEPRQVQDPRDDAWWTRCIKPLKNEDFRWVTLAFGAWMFSIGLVGSFTILYLTRVFGVSYSSLSATLISASIGTALAGIIWGHLMKVMGTRTFCAIMFLFAPLVSGVWFFMRPVAVSVPLLGMEIPQPVAVLLVANLIAGALFSGVGLSQVNLMASITRPAGRTMSMAVHWTFVGAIGALGPIAGGLLTDWFEVHVGMQHMMPTGTTFGFIHLLIFVQIIVVWGICLPALLRVQKLKHDVSIPVLVGNPLRSASLLWGLSTLARAATKPGTIKAVQLIGKQGDASVVGQLVSKLDDPDPDVREAAVEALGELGTDEAVSILVARLHDKDEELSPQLARALRKARHPSSVDVLVRRLEESDRETLTESARALGEIGDRRAVGPLRQLFSQSADAKVLGASGEALARLNVFEAVYDLLPRMRAANRPTLRRSLAVALGDLMGERDQFYALIAKEEHGRGAATGKLQKQIYTCIKKVVRDTGKRESLRNKVQEACDAYEQDEIIIATSCLHSVIIGLAQAIEGHDVLFSGRQLAAQLMRHNPRLGVAYWFLTDLAFWAEADPSRIDHVDVLLGLYVLSELSA
jgi:MFS family permease